MHNRRDLPRDLQLFPISSLFLDYATTPGADNVGPWNFHFVVWIISVQTTDSTKFPAWTDDCKARIAKTPDDVTRRRFGRPA
ncbi:MAG: hypothetical protein EAX87_03580 [Candidatus Thorarchaeota archaeon]|nr:hypothetical protein [Candidatus Thorarchaeota archaeon]